jgi:ech hydrogenase subunit D
MDFHGETTVMIEEQPLIPVTVERLVPEIQALRTDGWRLVQIGVTVVGDTFEVNYSFDRELHFRNLRLTVSSTNARLPSVSGVYFCAFLYENEIHDLFGISFDGLALDFKGSFYKTAKQFPFANACAPAPAATQPTA